MRLCRPLGSQCRPPLDSSERRQQISIQFLRALSAEFRQNHKPRSVASMSLFATSFSSCARTASRFGVRTSAVNRKRSVISEDLTFRAARPPAVIRLLHISGSSLRARISIRGLAAPVTRFQRPLTIRATICHGCVWRRPAIQRREASNRSTWSVSFRSSLRSQSG